MCISRYHKIVLSISTTFLFVISSIQPAFAWCGDNKQMMGFAKRIDSFILGEWYDGLKPDYENVHNDKTLAWAIDEGFSKDDSKLISEACKYVDSGDTFNDKNWHLGKVYYPEVDSWKKIIEYVQNGKINISTDEIRISHAMEYMEFAKNAIDQMKDTQDEKTRKDLRKYALTCIGNGIHPLQDFFGHMDAGKNDTRNLQWYNWYANMHHGEEGKEVELYYDDVKHVTIDVELLYDATNVDFIDGKWILIENSGNNTRLQKTDIATRQYLKEFKNYLNNINNTRGSIKGKVYNKFTNNAITNAGVSLFNNMNQYQAGGFTNSEGYYNIENVLIGEYKLVVNGPSLGLAPYYYNIGDLNKVTINPGVNQDFNIGVERELEKIESDVHNITLKIGEQNRYDFSKVNITGYYKDGGTENLTSFADITMDKPTIASFGGGFVTGITEGTATLDCKYFPNIYDSSTPFEDKITVTVLPRELVNLQVVSPTAQIDLKVGESKTLENLGIKINASYDNGSEEDVTTSCHKWIIGTDAETLNPTTDIAFVTKDESGTQYIRGVNQGIASLKCMIWDNGNDETEYLSIEIPVTVHGLTSITSNKDSLSINVGDDVRIVEDLGVNITGTYDDEGTIDITPNTQFSINNGTDFASIRQDGNVYYIKGLAGGTSSLQCTAWDGGQGHYVTLSIPVTINAVQQGVLKGVVKNAVTNEVISDVSISVLNSSGTTIATGSSNSSGEFNINVPVGTGLNITLSKDGYIAVNYGNIEVTENQTTYLETILQIDNQHTGLGNITGTISNAIDGQAVPGVTLNLRKGINVKSGDIISTVISNDQGNYSLDNLEAGNYTVEISKAGFTTSYFTVVSIGGTTKENQNGTITPVLSEGQTRIVLTWGESPTDLDSHLTGPAVEGSRFHVYYSNKSYYNGATEYVNLDVDDTTSYGPETTTIYLQSEGVYRFSVFDYSNKYSTSSLALSNSGATVKVYRGNESVATFYVPVNMVGTTWTVFELNGSTLTPINTISNDYPQ